MNGKKIIATLVVLTMVLSTVVVLKQLDVIKEASATTPGVDAWGDAKINLVYGVSYPSVTINTSTWTGSDIVYLYYPTYTNVPPGPNADEFTFNGPYQAGGISAYIAALDMGKNSAPLNPTGVSISFNRSGMWVFATAAQKAAGIDPGNSSTYKGYIWVNTSSVYTIQTISNFNYGSAGTLTVTVDTGDDTGCMISILDPDNNTIYHKWRPTSVSDPIKIDSTNFSLAGEYTVKAYRDFDLQNQMYLYVDEGGDAYGPEYGSGITATGYDYNDMGPWDPPEKNATAKKFTVLTGKPNIVLRNDSIFWGFEARIDLNVTDNEGKGIDETAPIVLRYQNKYIDFNTYITNEGDGNYSIEIPRYDDDPSGWDDLASAVGAGNINGTWRVYFAHDENSDGVYEWNNSATFVIKSASPPVQIVIVDPATKKVNVPAYTDGDGEAKTIEIVFDIFGTSLANVQGRAYYGDDSWEDNKNITIEGDILYPVKAQYDSVYGRGRWSAEVTPKKPGGQITLTIKWPGANNGTATQTIEIVNGTHVTVTTGTFTVGKDYNLTVKVIDIDGDAVKNAQVYLMWEDVPDQFNKTTGNNKVGNGLNGEYTFWIKPHKKDAQTPNEAPHNITIAARWYEGFWGYTKVVMERNHNMVVSVTPTTAYAGDGVEYDIMVTLLEGGNPLASGLSVALFNETGEYVTGIDEWYKDNAYDIKNELIVLSGGTYYISAMNATHDSEGNNATIIVTPYTVTFSPSVLAWKIDTETNMTFQVTPAGNGTLTLNNMTSMPSASIPLQSYQISIENGIGSLDLINATTLGNVTFDYTPDGGQARPANGLLRVTTATATPNPGTIYLGEPSVVTITVTHPATGAPLQGVEVGLDLNKNISTTVLAKLPSNAFTDAQGRVTFALSAEASGNVTIFLQNETDPDNPFVIFTNARRVMTISTSPSVDEGAAFTVSARSGGVLITDVPVTFVFDGQTYTTTTGTREITAPSVSTSLNYPITATAEGYTDASTNIMVINVPKLVIIPPSAEVSGTQKFTVTIANDAGAGVAGALVMFDGKEHYSGVNGICELTAPDVKEKDGAVYTISATFTGYASAQINQKIEQTKGMPGFELLTLIAAIGVAFLLLRRRRK